MTGRNEHALYAANIFISKDIRTTREMITKRISGQQKQPGSFILQAGPLSRSYHVAESICRVVECLTRDGRAAVSSSRVTSVTALCPSAMHINPSLVLVKLV